MTVAARVAEEAGTTLGQAVGYGIRFEDVTTPVSIASPLAHYEESGTTLQQGTLTAHGEVNAASQHGHEEMGPEKGCWFAGRHKDQVLY